jgi:hypothetical protein
VCNGTNLTVSQYAGVTVLTLQGNPANFRFTAGMAIDADGAPNAYHPEDIEAALDYLRNAGKPGNWWALVTDNDKPTGNPIIQGSRDLFPGYYISTTTLEDKTRARTDPSRYLNPLTVPYFVLPQKLAKEFGAEVGDFGVVIKRGKDRSEDKRVFAIYGDVGPPGILGEGSIALAKALGVPANPKTGGTSEEIDYIDYIVFPGSGNGKPRSIEEINAKGGPLLQAYEGLVNSSCSP